MKKHALYKKQSEKMCNLFVSGKSLSEIRDILNIPISGIYRILKENNINTKRNNSDFRYKMQKYKINESAFDKIDSSEKAYFLGFMYADGNAHSKRKQIGLKIQERDKEILNCFKNILETDRPLYFCNKTKKTHQNQYSIKISNSKLYDDFVKHGVTPRKTFTTKFPFHLDKKYYKHFIRGLFDGDGCIYIAKNGKTAEFSIIGSTQLCLDLKNLFKIFLDIDLKIQHDARCKSGVDRIRIRRYNDIKKVYKWMYEDAYLCLLRKKEKFLFLLKEHNDNL